MTNEIKEILDYFRKFMSVKDCAKVSIIGNYITNLQDKLYFMIGRSDEKQEIIDKAIEEINYMKTNMDITEIGAIKLEQILKGVDNEK